MRHALVEIRQPGRRPLRLVLTEDLELGRECDGLLLADPGVSRCHARLELGDGAVRIRDLASTNGTMVNGHLISGPTALAPGDIALVGGTELAVLAPVPDPAPAPAVVTAGTTAPDPGSTVAVPRPVLAGAGAFDPRQSSIARVADMVEGVGQSRPTLAPDGGDGDTLTIVFSDIESSTEHALALGDGRWYDLLAIHNSIVRNNLLRYGGTEIKSQGDGFMLTFTSARRALHFSSAVQRALARWSDEHPEEAMRIRIGLHTGEALVSADGDLFGKHVIVAARVANLAEGGEILASHVVVEIASARGDLDFGEGRVVALKGIDGPYTVHSVGWS